MTSKSISVTMDSFFNYLPRDRNWTLEEIRDEYLKVVRPAVLFSLFAMIVGTLGNCLVLYIFKFKYKLSNHRYFIICLAACDLISSLIGIPFLTVEMRLRYNSNTATCKTSRFLNHSFGFSSCVIIMTIAIERYLKICKSNGKQITNNMARRMCYFSIIFGIFFSLPSAFLYGRNSVQMDIQNITAYMCYYQDSYKDTVFPLMYQAFLVLCFIVAMITICACYTKIVYRIRTRNATQNIIFQCTKITNSLVPSDDVSSISNQLTLTDTFISNKKSNSSINAYRLAKMFFIVGAVYICSYIPYFGVSLANITKPNFLRSLSPTETTVIEICLKSFLINYFANPIVYGFLDRAFRAECQNLFYRMIRRR